MDSAFRNSEIWVRYSGGQLGQAEMSLSTPTDVLSLDCHLATAVSRFAETLEGYWTRMTSVSATYLRFFSAAACPENSNCSSTLFSPLRTE